MDIDNVDDLDAAPVAGPDEFWWPQMWQLARQLLADHAPDTDKLCTLCRESDPCPVRRLAVIGLVIACTRDRTRPSTGWLAGLRRRIAAGDLDPFDVPAEAMRIHRRRRYG